ncbi:DnaD domain-containing protein [Neobacillus niacini]|uniref:DnaD domain-containing protein n=1 Tax=Neobacillus niacini TaxID=86668 RepID=UPI0005EE7614|nr:DnaD domain protein [Neobacillus niacini]
MAKYRMVRTDFWKNPIVLEEMTPEDKYFYLYLLTNSNTTQTGIYKITKKQMAFDLGYSIEGVHSLMERFINHHKVIRYNPETRELAIKNWGKDNLNKAGKPVMDCIFTELKEIEDTSLIQYVSESIKKQEIRSLYESFCQQEEMFTNKKDIVQDEDDTYLDSDIGELEDVIPTGYMIVGQKQQPQSINPSIENDLDIEKLYQHDHETKDVKEIIEFWDAIGFGLTNMNEKQQLLSWLDDSRFLQPKAVILKAMNIAFANNNRRLIYVDGILKNWENESLLTVEEIDSYQENQKFALKQRQSIQSFPVGRDTPDGFVL